MTQTCSNKTHYFQCFEKLSKYPDLKEAVEELAEVFEKAFEPHIAELIMRFYEEFKDDQAKCVTMIWTSEIKITGLINCAIVVDAVNTYGYDKAKFKYYFDKFKKLKVDYKDVLTNSMKFIRILSSCVVDKGTTYNDEDRVTYRGIHKDIMQDVEEGYTFRIINWM